MKAKLLSILLAGCCLLILGACGRTASGMKNIKKFDTETAENASGQADTQTQTNDIDTPLPDTESTDTPESGPAGNDAPDDAASKASTESVGTDDKSSPQNTGDASGSSGDDTQPSPSRRSVTVNSPDDAVELLTAFFGTEDDETGYSYSFGYIGDFTRDGKDYYGFVWSWLVDGDHLSRLSDLLVAQDGSEILEGFYDGTDWELTTGNVLEEE